MKQRTQLINGTDSGAVPFTFVFYLYINIYFDSLVR